MSKRFDNKRLIYLLAGLITILILTIIIRIPKENATLKSKIIELDTTEVGKIVIYPRLNNEQAIEFNKSNDKWTVQQGTIISAPQKGAVQNIFAEVLNLKAQSLAAVSKAKWKEFELTDSLATRVRFLSKNGKDLADLMIGKFSYKQINNPYGGNRSDNIQGTSFVRLYSEKEIYSVDGFISFLFRGKFDDWRDKTFISSNKNDILSVGFTYPADSSFRLTKQESAWFAGKQMADSIIVAEYLNTLSNLSGQDIKDNFKPVINPSYQLMVEGNNLLNFSVKCYEDENANEYILNSSLNPEVYFTSKKDGIFAKLFKAQSFFHTKSKRK
jgi:hypothetical protein